MIEIEHIINSRPITYASDDFNNIRPIKPIDFLSPLSNNQSFLSFSENDLNDKDFRLKETTKDEVLDKWKITSNKLDSFWSRWKAEYLTSLRKKQRYQHQQNLIPKINDIVLLQDENSTRNFWKLVRVMELIKSEDNKI